MDSVDEDYLQKQALLNTFTSLPSEAHKKFHEKYRMKIIKLQCEMGVCPIASSQKIYDEYLEILNTRDQIADKKDSDLVWISISPMPCVDLKTFIKKVNLISSKKWNKNYIQVYEQRGEGDQIGTGFHSHILLRRSGKKFSEIRREIISSIKNIVDTEKFNGYAEGPWQCVLIKDDSDQVKRLRNYILGEKADEWKHPKQTADRLWRKLNSLEEFYSQGTV